MGPRGDIEHIVEFLRRVHPGLSAQACIRFVARKSGETTKVFYAWDERGLRMRLDELLTLNQQGYDAFFQVNPTATVPSRGGGGRAENVAYCGVIVLDWDVLKRGIDMQRVVDFLRAQGIEPSMYVESGNGVHGYLLLDRPYTPEETRPVAKTLCEIVNSDMVHSPSHLMRLPGTYNTKREPIPVLTRTCTDRRYTLPEIRDILIRLEVWDTREPTTPDHSLIPIAPDIAHVLDHCGDRVRGIIESGAVPDGTWDMSELDWRICCALIQAGATDRQIYEIYSTFPVSRLKANRAGAAYLERTVKRARNEIARQIAETRLSPMTQRLIDKGYFRVDNRGYIVPVLDVDRARRAICDQWDAWGLPYGDGSVPGDDWGLAAKHARNRGAN